MSREQYVVYLDFSEAFNTVFPSIFIEKSMKYSLHKRAVMRGWD